jgi:hypothetical protein
MTPSIYGSPVHSWLRGSLYVAFEEGTWTQLHHHNSRVDPGDASADSGPFLFCTLSHIPLRFKLDWRQEKSIGCGTKVVERRRTDGSG